MRKIFNLSNVYGVCAIVSFLISAGAVEGEMYITATVSMLFFGIFGGLAVKEDGGMHSADGRTDCG